MESEGETGYMIYGETGREGGRDMIHDIWRDRDRIHDIWRGRETGYMIYGETETGYMYDRRERERQDT